MATNSEIQEMLEKAAKKYESVADTGEQVLISIGELDIDLPDGRKTPNLNKRLAGMVQAVKSVNGKDGDIVLSREDLNIPTDEQLARQEKEDRFVITKDGRTQREINDAQLLKNAERITPLDHGAKGDAKTNDSLAFTNIETSISGQVVDLCGKTYLVDVLPIGNTYVNGFFKIASGINTGQKYHADDSDAVLSDATDTGALGTPYSGGLILNQYTSAGRSTRNRRALIASQGSRSSYQMGVNVGSIYSWADGNVSGNYSSRQSVAMCPQSVNIGTEEGGVWGFAGINAGAQFSIADGSRCGNFIARYCNAGGSRLAANFASHYSYAGGGSGLRTKVTIGEGGNVTSIEILDGGKYYTAGMLIYLDNQKTSNSTNAVLSYTLGTDGVVTAINIVDAGSGIDPSGTYSVKIIHQTSEGAECSANYSSNLSIAHNMYAGNYSSNGGRAYGFASANIASQTVRNYSKYGFIAGSNTVNALEGVGDNISVIGSSTVDITAGRTSAIASNGVTINGAGSIALGGYTVQADNQYCTITGRRVSTAADRTIVYGDAISGGASSANRKVQIGIGSGNITATGTITGSSPFADYAEYFENAVKGEIPLGTLVALDGDKVKVANGIDSVIGVVSGTAFIVGNDSEFTWNGRYLYGEFGEPLYHDVNCVCWSDYDGLLSEAIDIPEDAEYYTQTVQQENPDYNPSLENIPRSQRKDDWSCVGLMGQVYVRVGSDINIGDYLVADNGIGVPSSEKTNLKIMKITKEFDGEYGIAVCLLK